MQSPADTSICASGFQPWLHKRRRLTLTIRTQWSSRTYYYASRRAFCPAVLMIHCHYLAKCVCYSMPHPVRLFTVGLRDLGQGCRAVSVEQRGEQSVVEVAVRVADSCGFCYSVVVVAVASTCVCLSQQRVARMDCQVQLPRLVSWLAGPTARKGVVHKKWCAKVKLPHMAHTQWASPHICCRRLRRWTHRTHEEDQQIKHHYERLYTSHSAVQALPPLSHIACDP